MKKSNVDYQDWQNAGELDSSGSFELNAKRASELESQNLLEDPQDVISLVLQSLSYSNAQYLSVKVGVSNLTVSFRSEHDSAMAPVELYQLLEGQKKDSSPLSRWFTTAIRIAAKAYGQVDFKLGNSQHLRFSKGKAKLLKSQSVSESGCQDFYLKIGRKNFLHGLKEKLFRISGHSVLYQRCMMYPKPLMLDTIPIMKGWAGFPRLKTNWDESCGIRHILLGALFAASSELPEFQFALSGPQKFGPPQDGLQFSSQAYRKENVYNFPISVTGIFQENAPTLFHWEEPGVKLLSDSIYPQGLVAKTRFLERGQKSFENFTYSCGAALGAHSLLTGPARLYFIKNGVALNVVEKDLGCPGLICVSSAEGLQTDMSHFKIVENEALETRLSVLKNLTKKVLHLLNKKRDQLLPVAYEASRIRGDRQGPSQHKFVVKNVHRYRAHIEAHLPKA